MKTKLIITESQFDRLKTFITESEVYTSMVKQMSEDLTANYTPMENYVREGGEYHGQKMVKINVDDEVISPKSLFEYMKNKYNMGDDFTKQVITDWMFGNIGEDYLLSKNVPLK